MTLSASAIRSDIAQMIRPPERISVAEAASRYVNVRTASGGIQRWDPELTPYMIEPMDCLSSRKYDAVIFVGPAQSGKTQGLVTCSMAYIIKCDPSDFLIMQTTKGTARDFDTQVIKRAFRDSADLKMELAPGSKSDNTYDKVFKSGAILFQRWPSINEISGKPLKYMLITDYDRMTQNVDGEGSPFSLSQQRTAKYLSRGMTLVETSPGFEITDSGKKKNHPHEAPPCGGALSLFNMGDMRRWYVECPQCHEYFMPPPDESGLMFGHNRDLLGTTIAAMTTPVKYICTRNGCQIDLHHKRRMNAGGKWVPAGCKIENGEITGESVGGRIASFWFPGIFAAYSDPASLVEKYLKSHREYDITGSEENLKTVVNVGFGAPYMPQHLVDNENREGLSERVEHLDRYFVPDDARLLIASVDVQGGKMSRFVVQVHAIGIGLEQWVVDRFDIAFTENETEKRRINPGSYLEDWQLLIPRVIMASYKTSSGKKMLVHKAVIDTGGEGDTTNNAYQFYRKLRKAGMAGKVMLIKGGSGGKMESPIIGTYGKDPSGRQMKEIPLFLLNTNFFKDIVASILRRVSPGGMYMHFPQWLDEGFFDELRAEVRKDNGKWEKISPRNETLDLCVYILAGCWKLGLNSDRFNWSSPPSWAAEHGLNSNVVDRDDALKKRTNKPKVKKPKRNSSLL